MTFFSRLFFFVTLLSGGVAQAQGTPATHGDRAGPMLEAQTLEAFLVLDPSDVIYGSPTAPLTLFEFSSFTCPHCARLHADVLPEITKAYVDTGKVKIVFRDFPLDQFAAGVGLLAQCLIDPESYYGFVEDVFATQDAWRQSDQAFADIMNLAQKRGLSEDQMNACVQNQASLDFLLARRQLAGELIPVRGTPTLMLGATQVPADLDGLRAALDAALSEAELTALR